MTVSLKLEMGARAEGSICVGEVIDMLVSKGQPGNGKEPFPTNPINPLTNAFTRTGIVNPYFYQMFDGIGNFRPKWRIVRNEWNG